MIRARLCGSALNIKIKPEKGVSCMGHVLREDFLNEDFEPGGFSGLWVVLRGRLQV